MCAAEPFLKHSFFKSIFSWVYVFQIREQKIAHSFFSAMWTKVCWKAQWINSFKWKILRKYTDSDFLSSHYGTIFVLSHFLGEVSFRFIFFLFMTHLVLCWVVLLMENTNVFFGRQLGVVFDSFVKQAWIYVWLGSRQWALGTSWGSASGNMLLAGTGLTFPLAGRAGTSAGVINIIVFKGACSWSACFPRMGHWSQ